MAFQQPTVKNTNLRFTALGQFGGQRALERFSEALAPPSFGTRHSLLQHCSSMAKMGPPSSPFANGATFLGFEMAARVLDRL